MPGMDTSSGTLRDMVGRFWLIAYCATEPCEHSRRIDPADLADRYGLDHPIAPLLKRMRCEVCGGRGATMRIQPPHRPDFSDGPRGSH